MTTMYKNDAIAPVKDSPHESGLAILFDYSFFQSLKNTATILARDTADLVTKGILPDLSTSDKKVDTVEERARRAADIIAADPGLTKQEDRDEITKMFKDAKENHTEYELLRAINDDLKKQGFDGQLKISEQHVYNPRTDEHLNYETLDLVKPRRGLEPMKIYVGLICEYTEGKVTHRRPK